MRMWERRTRQNGWGRFSRKPLIILLQKNSGMGCEPRTPKTILDGVCTQGASQSDI